MKFLFSFVFILNIGAAFIAAQKPTDGLTEKLERDFAASNFPGFCVSVVSRDRTVYQHGFGYANVKNKSPYTVNTIQPVGSVSKTLIGTALMKAVELGWFSLNTNINEILDFKVSNPYYPEQPITIRQLATHTSGIIDREKVYQKTYRFGRKSANTSLDVFLRPYLTKKGKFYSRQNFDRRKPGTAFNYSNIGAILVARLIEIIIGLIYSGINAILRIFFQN